jgi:DNA replication licensing factor MCM2
LRSDYEAKPELDKYEQDGLDDDEQDELGYRERRAADIQMNQQYQRENKMKSRRPGAFNDEDYDENDVVMREMRMQKFKDEIYDGDEVEMEGMKDVLDYEDVKGKLSLWVQRKEVTSWIRKKFTVFLRSFVDEETGANVHEQRI